MRTKLLLTGLAAALAACGGDNTTCGTGTTKMGGECVATDTGSGGPSCGPGTHVMGAVCAPDDTTMAAAPTITMIDPAQAGISGGGLFTITGTGFNGSNVTDLHVFFGDPATSECEATLGAASATMVSGQIPFGCTFSPAVTVTVQTNLGMATTPFNYIEIFAGDGDAGGDFNGDGGDIYVIDPFAARSFDLGTLGDGSGNAYAYGGMDFDTTGALFAATTGDSPADVDGTSQLITIDISTGAVTVIGDLTDEAGNAYFVQDLKFAGGTLYAWAVYDTTSDGGPFEPALFSVDKATGALTQIGEPLASWFAGGMALDASNNLVVVPNGAGSDSGMQTTGEIDTVNTTDGTLTNVVTSDWPVGSPVSAMTTFPAATPFMLAVIDNGSYGYYSGTPIANQTLAIIDPAADTGSGGDTIVTPAFELPGQTGAQPRIDAMAIPPSTLVLQRKLPHTGWTQLKMAAGGHPIAHR